MRSNGRPARIAHSVRRKPFVPKGMVSGRRTTAAPTDRNHRHNRQPPIPRAGADHQSGDTAGSRPELAASVNEIILSEADPSYWNTPAALKSPVFTMDTPFGSMCFRKSRTCGVQGISQSLFPFVWSIEGFWWGFLGSRLLFFSC